jgi:hypothetical protein
VRIKLPGNKQQAVDQIKRVIPGDTSERRRPGIFFLVSISYECETFCNA